MNRLSNAPNHVDSLFNEAVASYRQGDRVGAQQLCKRILAQNAAHIGVLHLAGAIELDSGRARNALQFLEQAEQLAPQHPGIQYALGNGYFQTRRWPQAARAYRQTLTAQPNDPALLNQLGLALRESGAIEEAITAFHRALDLAPNDAGIHNNLAIALNARHDYNAAISAYSHALTIDPRNVDFIANLATLYEQTNRLAEAQQSVKRGLNLAPSHSSLNLIGAKCARRMERAHDAIARLEALDNSAIDARMRRAIEFELGRCRDNLKQTDPAFRHFTDANALTTQVWPELATGAYQYLKQLETSLEAFTPEWVAAWTPDDPNDNHPVPVFMIGFPRSGTTLLDTMLDAHPRIAVLEERPTVSALIDAVKRMPGGYPMALADMSTSEIDTLRARYWAAVNTELGETVSHRLVVDKLPLNTADVGMIHRIFPTARFLFSLRHPCDVCLSGFMQEAAGAVYANFTSLDNVANVYTSVMTLWQQYQLCWPLQVHTVRYEELIAQREATLHDVLCFLDLPWVDELQDHTAHAQRRGRIYTPSYHQVVRPIYQDAIARWRRYERYFEAVMPRLKPYIERFGYAPQIGSNLKANV